MRSSPGTATARSKAYRLGAGSTGGPITGAPAPASGRDVLFPRGRAGPPIRSRPEGSEVGLDVGGRVVAVGTGEAAQERGVAQAVLLRADGLDDERGERAADLRAAQ